MASYKQAVPTPRQAIDALAPKRRPFHFPDFGAVLGILDAVTLPFLLAEDGRITRQVLHFAAASAAGRQPRVRLFAAAPPLLAKRLSRRGLAGMAGALAASLAETASARVADDLRFSAIQAARALSPGQAAGGVIPAKVAALTQGVLKTMLFAKLKIGVAAAVLVVGVLPFAGGSLSEPPTASGLGGARQATAKPATGGRQFRGSETNPPLARVWKVRQVIKPQPDKGDQVFCAAVSPDGNTVVSAQASGTKLSDAATGRERMSLTDECTWTLAFSPDGKTLATGHSTAVKLWDTATGKERATLEGQAKNCHSVAFSPDGKTLASASETIRLWEVATGKEVRRFESSGPKANGVYCIAFSADGKRLASAEGSDKTVKLWDVPTGKEVKTLTVHTEFAIAVAFSPDGKTVASGGGEGEIKLWDTATGKERRTLKGQTTGFHSLVYSPDGRILASAAGGAKTVQLWEVATGKELTSLMLHTKQVWAVAFSRDGDKLVTASDDAVRLWQAEQRPGENK